MLSTAEKHTAAILLTLNISETGKLTDDWFAIVNSRRCTEYPKRTYRELQLAGPNDISFKIAVEDGLVIDGGRSAPYVGKPIEFAKLWVAMAERLGAEAIWTPAGLQQRIDDAIAREAR